MPTGPAPTRIPNRYPPFSGLRIEFSSYLAYAENADEFVRLNCRVQTGWRRDEWAQSPLFIWGKKRSFGAIFLGIRREIQGKSRSFAA